MAETPSQGSMPVVESTTGSPSGAGAPAGGWSGWLPAFRLAGVDVRIHALAVPVQAAVAFALSDSGPREALARFGVLLLLLAVVLLHEMSHGIVARAIGLRVLDVRVHAIGGVARIERRPPSRWTPREEWLPAIAGPVGNLVVAGLAIVVALALGRSVEPFALRSWVGDPLSAFVGGNLLLGLVNLVPAFPSDGGRVLRAVLARRLSYLRATSVALAVGAVFVAAGVAALVLYAGPRALLGAAPIVALLALYGVAERRVAIARARLETFVEFVEANVGRFPALATLRRDGYDVPVPDPAVLDAPEIRAALEAFAAGRSAPA